MLRILRDKWAKNEDTLRNRYEAYPCIGPIVYQDVVEETFDAIWNDADATIVAGRICREDIVQIDQGDSFGSLMYLIPMAGYQPTENDYLMTYIRYGESTAEDRLLAIQAVNRYKKPTPFQVNQLMSLSLDILKHTVRPYNGGWRDKNKFEQIETEN